MPASTDQVEMSGAAFVPVCVKVHGGSPPRKRWGTLIQSAIAKTVPWPASDRGFAYKATSARRLGWESSSISDFQKRLEPLPVISPSREDGVTFEVQRLI